MLFLAILTLTVVYIRDGVDGVAVPCVALKVLSATIGMIPICLLSFVFAYHTTILEIKRRNPNPSPIGMMFGFLGLGGA